MSQLSYFVYMVILINHRHWTKTTLFYKSFSNLETAIWQFIMDLHYLYMHYGIQMIVL